MCFSDCDFVKTIMNMVVLHGNIDEILSRMKFMDFAMYYKIEINSEFKFMNNLSMFRNCFSKCF